MAAIVTDQFRILNASNFVESVENSSNSYYVFASLPNPAPSTIGFGRTGTDVANYNSNVIPPVDSINNTNHVSDTMLFGRRIGDANVRRLIKKRTWTSGTTYEMYLHDYTINSKSPLTDSSRLYDANYFVMNTTGMIRQHQFEKVEMVTYGSIYFQYLQMI